MPTPTREYSLYEPGSLVTSAKDLFSTIPLDGDGGSDDPGTVATGTIGVIIQGPNSERRSQYQVQFLRNIVWWVNAVEIEPYFVTKIKK